jgi:predicted  nucleic acid-binding Zn-ribbon protein
MTSAQLKRKSEARTVSAFEAFQTERFALEERIQKAAEKIAKANNDADRQKAKRLYDMLCEERRWL